MKKELTFRGKTAEELKAMPLSEFMEMIPSRARRSLKRGFTDEQKTVLEKLKKGDSNLKTHARDMVVLPAMLGQTLKVYTGKEYFPVTVTEEMLGHVIGEFVMTRRRVAHNAPGIGSTKSSSSVSVR